MKLPSVRLTITATELALLKPGLQLLRSRLLMAEIGHFPHRNPWDRIDLERSKVHQPRSFSPDMAAHIVSLHRGLAEATASRKVRLNCFEIAALAFALRLGEVSHSAQAIEIADLQRKLEMYRKRAKTAAQRRLDKLPYAIDAEKWRRFVRWCRYHLLYESVPALKGPYSRKTHWAEQRSNLGDLIAKTVAAHHFAPPSASEMTRVVKLVKEELRRGRHPLTLKEVLADSEGKGSELLFEAVSKKLLLSPLLGAELPPGVAEAERGEKFKARTPTVHPNQAPLPLPTTHEHRDANTTAAVTQKDPPSPTTQLEPSDEELWQEVSGFLQHEADVSIWQDTVNYALTIAQYFPGNRRLVPISPSFVEVIAQMRPARGEFNLDDAADFRRFLARWIFTFVWAYRPQLPSVADILKEGYYLALRTTSQEPKTA